MHGLTLDRFQLITVTMSCISPLARKQRFFSKQAKPQINQRINLFSRRWQSQAHENETKHQPLFRAEAMPSGLSLYLYVHVICAVVDLSTV